MKYSQEAGFMFIMYAAVLWKGWPGTNKIFTDVIQYSLKILVSSREWSKVELEASIVFLVQ